MCEKCRTEESQGTPSLRDHLPGDVTRSKGQDRPAVAMLTNVRPNGGVGTNQVRGACVALQGAPGWRAPEAFCVEILAEDQVRRPGSEKQQVTKDKA